jgi:hypothetical protein
MPFDPNKPFTPVAKAPFDPNKPFEPAKSRIGDSLAESIPDWAKQAIGAQSAFPWQHAQIC